MSGQTLEESNLLEEFREDVLIGLSAERKWLPPKYFYDEKGSVLFESITEQPEYYPTRSEASILEEIAPRLREHIGGDVTLVELGSGSSAKTRILITHLLELQKQLHYIPIDISPTILAESAKKLHHAYPGLEVHPIAATYETGMKKARALVELQPEMPPRRLSLFLGSSIGNMRPHRAIAFLEKLRDTIGEPDRILVGFDLKKDPEILRRAYDDEAGATAAFNINILERINRDLGGDFDLGEFSHQARFNEHEGRIEMHLASARAQEVYIGSLSRAFEFRQGETIHTESSYKYDETTISFYAAESRFRVQELFCDPKLWFALALLRPLP